MNLNKTTIYKNTMISSIYKTTNFNAVFIEIECKLILCSAEEF